MALDFNIFKPKAQPLFGMDISSSSVKMVEVMDAGKGAIRVERYVIESLPKDAVVDGNIANLEAVEEAVQRERLRLTDRLPLEKLQALGAALAVDYVFVGSVNEFGMVRDLQDELPTVSIALRMVSCSTGNIVWAATHTKRGDDSESLFRLGRIDSLEELTAIAAHEMIPTLLPEEHEAKPGAGNTP